VVKDVAPGLGVVVHVMNHGTVEVEEKCFHSPQDKASGAKRKAGPAGLAVLPTRSRCKSFMRNGRA
jgi:hypothetical protein